MGTSTPQPQMDQAYNQSVFEKGCIELESMNCLESLTYKCQAFGERFHAVVVLILRDHGLWGWLSAAVVICVLIVVRQKYNNKDRQLRDVIAELEDLKSINNKKEKEYMSQVEDGDESATPLLQTESENDDVPLAPLRRQPLGARVSQEPQPESIFYDTKEQEQEQPLSIPQTASHVDSDFTVVMNPN